MPTSSVPAVWTALHALVDGLGLTITRNGTYPIPVSFGPPITEDSSFIAVGYSDAGEAINGDFEWAGLGTRSQDEGFSIDCTIFTTSGDADLQTRITEAYSYLTAITDALATDYTLGGACQVAQVARQTCTPVQDAGGSAAALTFTVAVAARI